LLTFEQIKELVELIAARGLHGMEVERSGFRLKIEGQAPVAAHAPSVAPTSFAAAGAAEPGVQSVVAPVHLPGSEAAAAGPPPVASPGTADHILTSPIVGTFYRASSPDSSPFTEVGARVKKGQVLCIIEAMKLMNEIESDADGVISQIYPQNAQAVEFGQPLFAIRAS
jgi:acetyl-CoA carboxylase biotin carboxyl carrier protein